MPRRQIWKAPDIAKSHRSPCRCKDKPDPAGKRMPLHDLSPFCCAIGTKQHCSRIFSAIERTLHDFFPLFLPCPDGLIAKSIVLAYDYASFQKTNELE
jgi:hypothetical protein